MDTCWCSEPAYLFGLPCGVRVTLWSWWASIMAGRPPVPGCFLPWPVSWPFECLHFWHIYIILHDPPYCPHFPLARCGAHTLSVFGWFFTLTDLGVLCAGSSFPGGVSPLLVHQIPRFMPIICQYVSIWSRNATLVMWFVLLTILTPC